MPQEFTAKFKVDISDLKKNIAESNRQIKLANAEFEAASAGMDDWSKSADGISAKLKQLSKTLDAQKAVLNAYREQMERQQAAYEENGKRAKELEAKLEELRKNGVSPMSDEYRGYEKALAQVEQEQEKNRKSVEDLQVSVLKQEAAVGKTEKQIRDYDSRLEELDGTMGDAAESTEDLNEATEDSAESMEDLKKASADARKEIKTFAENAAKKVEKALLAIGAATVGAVASLAKLVISSAGAADELGDMAKKTGLTTTQLQKYRYTADMVGTSLETITGAQAKLVKTMSSAASGTGASAEAFRKLNVNVKNADGTLRKADDVFLDVIDSLGGIENETERDAIAMSIFGKSAQELNPLIKEGSQALRDYSDEAEELGAIVSEDVVNALGDVQTEIKHVNAQFTATQQNVAAQFAPIIKEALIAVQDVLKRVNEIIQDPRIKASIERLGEAFKEFVDKALNNVLDALPKLIDVATWLISNFDKLIITLGSLWAVFKGVSVVTGAVNAFKTLKTAFESVKTAALAAKAANDTLNTSMEATSAASGGWVGLIIAAAAALSITLVTAIKKADKAIEEQRTKIKEGAEKGLKVYREETDNIIGSMQKLRDEFDKTASTTESAAERSRTLIKRLRELEKQNSLTSEEQREYAAILQQIRAIMPDINIETDKQTGLLKEGADALYDQVEALEKKARAAAIEERLTEEYRHQIELTEELNRARNEQSDYAEKLAELNELESKLTTEILNQGKGALQTSEHLGRLNVLSQELTGTNYKYITTANAASSANAGYLATINDLEHAYVDSVVSAESLLAEFETYDVKADEVTEATDAATDAVEDLGEQMDETGKKAEELAEEHFTKVVDKVTDIFDKIDEKTDLSMKKIIDTLKHNAEALTTYQENLRTIAERGASENVMNYLESLGVEQAGVIALIANSTDKEFQKFIAQFDKNTELAHDAGKEWGEMMGSGTVEGAEEKLPEMKKIKKKYFNVWDPEQAYEKGEEHGKNVGQGAADGVESKIPLLKKMGKKAAKAVADAFADFMQIESPSKLFKRFGAYTGEGFVLGFDKEIPLMGKTSKSAAKAVADAFRKNIGSLAPRPAAVDMATQARTWAGHASSAMNASSAQAVNKINQNKTVATTNYTQNIYAPKSPSRIEIYRDTRNLLALTREGLNA